METIEFNIWGKRVLIDASDAHILGDFRWVLNGGRRGERYVVRWVERNGKQTVIALHREIVRAPEGMVVDHINGNVYDNRRSNLRVCSTTQNLQNRRYYKARKEAKFKGVNIRGGLIYAQISRGDGSSGVRYLGRYDSQISAARAYDAAAKILFGEFACLNFPSEVNGLDAIHPNHRNKLIVA